VVAGSTSTPGYKLVDNPNYPEIVADYQRTFQILKTLPCDIFLGPHGNFFDLTKKSKLIEQGEKQNPFIDPDGYKRYIEENEKAFQTELERQKQ
jgi:metallo-beta-lactamase class B